MIIQDKNHVSRKINKGWPNVIKENLNLDIDYIFSFKITPL